MSDESGGGSEQDFQAALIEENYGKEWVNFLKVMKWQMFSL